MCIYISRASSNLYPTNTPIMSTSSRAIRYGEVICSSWRNPAVSKKLGRPIVKPPALEKCGSSTFNTPPLHGGSPEKDDEEYNRKVFSFTCGRIESIFYPRLFQLFLFFFAGAYFRYLISSAATIIYS